MPWTEEYKRKYQRDRKRINYAARRLEYIERYGACVLCGSRANLEIDHVRPEDKVTSDFWGWSKAKREVELAKCQVLCHECHLVKTSLEKKSVTRHGSWAMYRNHKCRCDKCLRFMREKYKEVDRKRNTNSRSNSVIAILDVIGSNPVVRSKRWM